MMTSLKASDHEHDYESLPSNNEILTNLRAAVAATSVMMDVMGVEKNQQSESLDPNIQLLSELDSQDEDDKVTTPFPQQPQESKKLISRSDFAKVIGILLRKPFVKEIATDKIDILKLGKFNVEMEAKLKQKGVADFNPIKESKTRYILRALTQILRRCSNVFFEIKGFKENLNTSTIDKLKILKAYYERYSMEGTVNSHELRVIMKKLIITTVRYKQDNDPMWKPCKELKRVIISKCEHFV